jgi:hypothetical protein
MLPLAIAETQKTICTVKKNPAVIITMPFDPKMCSKDEISRSIKRIVSKVEAELLLNHSSVKAIPVINKLHRIFRELNYYTYKKSIVIFLSDTVEKVFYLNMELEENTMFDSSFAIRNLIYNKKQAHQFLVLGISVHRAGMYVISAPDSLRLILNQSGSSKLADQLYNGNNSVNTNNSAALDEYLHQLDNNLSLILNSYSLPAFIAGSPDIVNRFKGITKNAGSIVGNIHCNFEDISEKEFAETLKPRIADWPEIHNQYLLHKIADAISHKSLCFGVNNVLSCATKKNGRLLVLEKDYPYTEGSIMTSTAKKETDASDNRFYVKAPIDDVIEKILENDGDVDFVENGKLKDFNHVALI